MYNIHNALLVMLISMSLLTSSRTVSSERGARDTVAVADMDPAVLACVPPADAAVASDAVDPHELIVEIGQRYGVPPGILYAIWQKETRGLERGWGEGRGWFKAYRLSYSTGRCVEAYGPTMCWNNWLRVKAICGQQRKDGRPVCDPMKVRTAYGLEMGPMMFLPSTLLRDHEDGTLEWTRYATDYDGDGVIDPHSLPDAMASAAKYLRHHYERKSGKLDDRLAWRYAIIRYNGAAEYYYGKPAVPGVIDYWDDWCGMPDNCMSHARSGDRDAIAYN